MLCYPIARAAPSEIVFGSENLSSSR